MMDDVKLKNPNVVCLLDYYLPGFRAGGAIRSVSNLIEALGDYLNFQVITRDTDWGETIPYIGVRSDAWTKKDGLYIYYVSTKKRALVRIWRLCKNSKYDILYINSIYSFLFSIFPLLLRRVGLLPSRVCIIAPRGEFSRGAMTFKSARKRAYVFIAKNLGFFERVTWQASSKDEALDILFMIGAKCESNIVIAPDLAKGYAAQADYSSLACRNDCKIPRVVFLARIVPIKNLDFLLRVLSKIDSEIMLSIYGPKDDSEYWSHCESLIRELPLNIHISVHDAVQSSEVGAVFAQNDLFAFPTLGENFGHVIIESLSAGTPVLVSDKTFWCADDTDALRVIPLVENLWIESFKEIFKDVDKLRRGRNDAVDFAKKYNSNPELLEANKRLFLQILNK